LIENNINTAECMSNRFRKMTTVSSPRICLLNHLNANIQ